MRRILLFAAAMALSAGVAAQAYKWVDENGKTRYGDQPPPGVKATRLQGPPPPSSPPPAASKSGEKPLTPEQAFQKRQKERAEAEQKEAKEGADAETRRVNCEQSQAALRSLQS